VFLYLSSSKCQSAHLEFRLKLGEDHNMGMGHDMGMGGSSKTGGSDLFPLSSLQDHIHFFVSFRI